MDDGGFPGSGQTHYWRQAAEVRHHRTGLVGHAAGRGDGIQVAHFDGVAPRSDYCTGTPADYAAVHALQDKISLVPLSSYGKPYTPPAGQVDPNVDMKTAIRDQVDHLDVIAYFTYLAQLMKANPPSAEDAPMVANMAKIGLVPGQDFDPSKLGAFDKEAIKAVPKLAQAKVMEFAKKVEPVNGWLVFRQDGSLRDRLSGSGVHDRHRSWRQSASGCNLSDRREGRERRRL